MTRFVFFFCSLILLLPMNAGAWHESGHHLVALLGFDLLTKPEQQKIIEIMKSHPRLEKDFAPPRGVEDEFAILRYRVGTIGYWPDITRGSDFDRPNWHYQLGATLVLGDDVNVPQTPGPVPDSATMKTKKLHIAQAIELCQKVLADESQPNSDRALAICWIAHLVGDAHQPCHSGSLYAEKVFPNGDRGANLIKTQRSNLHSLWDGFLGGRYDSTAIQRRLGELKTDHKLIAIGEQAVQKEDGLEPLVWLAESREAGLTYVYDDEVLSHVKATQRGFTDRVPKMTLSEDYLKRGGDVSRKRAVAAGHRLAAIWRDALRETSTSNEAEK